MSGNIMKVVVVVGLLLLSVWTIILGGIVFARPAMTKPGATQVTYADKQGDQELAYLLVKLVLKTRATIGGHYTRAQSVIPGVDFLHKRSMTKNLILPAAVADQVFSEVVPGATGGRAWVRMVVEEPRNPNNRGDAVALELLEMIQAGQSSAERSIGGAYYYAEPIKATSTCLPCHGEPRGEADPAFPQFNKDGWRDGDIVGAVVARVAPEEL